MYNYNLTISKPVQSVVLEYSTAFVSLY